MEAIETQVTKINLSQILLDFNRTKKTGTLTVRGSFFTKKIYLNKGEAIFASSTNEHDRLGEVLLKLGKITNSQYATSPELLKETSKKQGAALVEQGFLTPKELILGVQYQVREIIHSLFQLEKAEWEFEEGKLPWQEVMTLHMKMGELIYEGLKRNNNLVRIRREIPDMQAVVQLNSNPSDLLKNIVLDAQDETMLASIDGTRTVSEVIKSSSSNSFDAIKALYVLYSTGFIEEQKENVKNADLTLLQAEAIESYPVNALSEETPEHQSDSASSDTEVDLFSSSETNVQPEVVKQGNGDTTEKGETSESITTTDSMTPAAADVLTGSSSGTIDEPEKTNHVEEIRDRRRYRRFKVEGAEVNGEMLYVKEVKVLDMSIGGIALETDRQVKIGKEYLLNLQDQDKTIAVKVVVVRSTLLQSKADGSGDVIPLYFVGMQFINLSDEKINEIVQFIDNHKVGVHPVVKTNGRMEQRKSNRFQMNVDGKTVLNFQELYKVKVISLNGMLIESSHLLDIEDRLYMKIYLTQDKMIDFVGRVASCSEKGEGDRKRYDIGIEFIEISEEHTEILKKFFVDIKDIQKCDITAVQAETPAREKISAAPRLNTGDADLFILQGRYADAMSIYNELLSKEPDEMYILERIEALATLITNSKDDTRSHDKASGDPVAETTEVKRQRNGGISTNAHAELENLKRKGSPHMNKEPLKGGNKSDGEIITKTKKNGSGPRWYGKLVRRILPGSSDNSS
jgi:Domain of unknown function (DUF4388)/PilZ domain